MNKELINKLSKYKGKHGLPTSLTSDEKEKLARGMPFQKILGFIKYGDVTIDVSKNVLIPRFETEELVEFVSGTIKCKSKVLDLCSGSGYIGIAISKKLKLDKVYFSDISKEAIEQTKMNIKKNNIVGDVILSDLFNNITGKFDVIVSNPPYIPTTDKLDKSVLEFEPHDALFAGVDGNYFIRKIVEEAHNYINKDGYLFLEICKANKIFLEKNGFAILNDINGNVRFAYKKY